jgi:hypothetical protein
MTAPAEVRAMFLRKPAAQTRTFSVISVGLGLMY